MAVQFPLPGAEVIQPLGLAGPTEQAVPVIALQPTDPQAREKLGGFASPGDEFDDAPVEADPGNEFDTVDELKARSVEDLAGDRDNFNPVSWFEQNPNLANSPEDLAKLLSVYRQRRQEGLDAGRVAKAAVTGAPGMLKKFAVGARDVGANIVDTVLQPTANVLGAAITGDLADPKRRSALFSETRRNLKKSVAELSAAEESTATSLLDLARQGSRKVKPLDEGVFFNPSGGGSFYRPKSEDTTPIKKEVTDQDLLTEISDDVQFRKTAAEVLRGEGEVAKAWGLDAESLAKEGITLDKDAIESLSMADPLTTVGSAGALRLVSASGKVLATARTAAGLDKVTSGLGKLAKGATESVVGRPIQAAGKLTTLAGESVRAPGLISAATVGSIMAGGGIPTSLGAAIAARGASKAARVIGPKIEAAGAKIAKEGNVAINALSELAPKVVEGAALGAASTAPLAVLTDDDQAAGAILGAGIALGAVGAGAERSFQVVKSKAAQTLFGPNRAPIPDVPSAAYGRDASLDLVHQENVTKLPEADRAEVNNFRELVRNQGGEVYSVDQATFRQKIADTFAAETGRELTPEALKTYEIHHGFFDETGPDGKKIVYLNADNRALSHDSGHIFDALLPEEKRIELRNAVKKAFSEDDISAFKKKYEEDAGTPITDEAAISEMVAEQFSAVFRAVPATELAAPKTLLSKFGNAIAEQAEKWGVDLTGGATTPDRGAPVAVGVRTLFRDAARTVAEAGNPKGTKGPLVEPPPPSNVVAFPGGDVPPPSPPAGGVPTPPITPPAPASAAPTPPPTPAAPNIRVTKAQQDSFSHRNAETGISRARELAAADPVVAARVNEISQSLEAGNPVLEIEHLGIVSETSAAGRRTRVGEQEGGYAELERLQIENRAEAPESVVNTHQKTFVPVRWTEQGGTPTLIAVSLDKTIANIRRVAKESQGKGVEDIIPYELTEGKFTDAAWEQIIADSKSYAENHANGYRGDGKKLVRPAADVGLSIPAENPGYAPKILSDDVMNFQNLLQGLNTPATAREVRSQIPGNIKAQVLASANQRTLLEPAAIRPRNAGKQEFASFPGRTVKEVNPMRNELARKGVNVDSLIPVTERLRAKDIVSVKPRPELGFKAPVTDIVRGGFLPAPTEFRQKTLGGRTVSEFSDYVLNAPSEEFKNALNNMTGGLTGGAWNLGLGLKEAGDVAVLKKFQNLADVQAKEVKAKIIETKDFSLFDQLQDLALKTQFFREAYEAATGTGSAGAAFKRDVADFGNAKIPFPQEETPK